MAKTLVRKRVLTPTDQIYLKENSIIIHLDSASVHIRPCMLVISLQKENPYEQNVAY